MGVVKKDNANIIDAMHGDDSRELRLKCERNILLKDVKILNF